MDFLSKIQRKWHRTFCKHEWKFEGVSDTRQCYPRHMTFVYVCKKCGAHKIINCEDIKARIRKYGGKDNYDYIEETVLLANGYGPGLESYTGRDVGRAVQWYWDNEGVLISAYANEYAVESGRIPTYKVE